MKVLIKTFKGKEEEITKEINKILEKCMGDLGWGTILDVKTILIKKLDEINEFEMTVMIQYKGSS